jgi:hypothetical protein
MTLNVPVFECLNSFIEILLEYAPYLMEIYMSELNVSHCQYNCTQSM